MDLNNFALTPAWYIDKKAEENPYEGTSIEDVVEEARRKRRERDKKMTEAEDELIRLVRDLGL